MNFEPTRQLQVSRILSNGQKVSVGTLAQNSEQVYFSYHADYVEKFGNLSPFAMKLDTSLQLAPKQPHFGLHGVFADSLPDGWGLLLQDRFFRQKGILPQHVTAMDRLAFVGDRGIGALIFEPSKVIERDQLDYAQLGLAAQAVFDGQTEDILEALLTAGSSGGARPKAQIFMPKSGESIARSQPNFNDEAWIIKFTSKNLPLGHEEGLCEAIYLTMAEQAQLKPCQWRLLDAPATSGAAQWLALKRFDWVNNENGVGRYHQHSLSGLLNADFRLPSLDYEDLIKASKSLCQSQNVAEIQFRRAIFNLFSSNQDDHGKNWAFLQNDQGEWKVSPFYDVTFSPHPFGEHSTAFGGFGKKPSVKAMQKLAQRAGLSWSETQKIIQQILDALSQFPVLARDFGVKNSTVKLIQNELNRIWGENKTLLD